MPSNLEAVSQEIDLVVVSKTIWEGKRKLIFFVLGFAVFGLVLAFLTPKEYTAQTIWVNQTDATFSGGGGFVGIAEMVGFDLKAMEATNELTTEDYIDFIESLSFQYALMHAPLKWDRFDELVSLHDYYAEYYRPGVLKTIWNYTVGLPGVLLKMGKRDEVSAPHQVRGDKGGPVKLLETEVWVRYILLDCLDLSLNEGRNMITLEAKCPDPVAAAELARVGQELLKEKITKLKIDKAQQSLDFTQQLFEERKAAFEKAQDKLAQF